MAIVKVHSGSGHVRGTARKYPYYVASVFVITNGRYKNESLAVGPFRSFDKCVRLARKYAADNGHEFREGYGSLHNQPIEEHNELSTTHESNEPAN